jgi:hypothetical protein
MRIRSLNKGIYGISSTRSSVWRIDGEHGGFLVERRMMLTRIAQVNGTLRKENDNTTFIQFEYRLNPQMVFMFYLVLILALVAIVGNYNTLPTSFLGEILGIGFVILVGIHWIGYPIRLARLVRRVLSE